MAAQINKRRLMYYASAKEMAELDRLALENGLEIRQMMELAGWHILKVFKQLGLGQSAKTAVLAGKGNKGGDGLCAARHLINHGWPVDIFLMSADISPDAAHQLDLLQKMAVDIRIFKGQDLSRYAVIIDALIGYSLKGQLSSSFAAAVKAINSSGAVVIAYDLPTGIDATTGKPAGTAVKANATLMLALPKKAVLVPQARRHFGKIYLADIGIPTFLYDQIKSGCRPDFGDGLTLVPEPARL